MNELRSMNVRAHVAQNLTRTKGRSAIDGRRRGTPAMPRASGSASALKRLRLDQDRRRTGETDGPRVEPRRMGFTFAARGLQPRPAAEAHGANP